MPFIEHLLLSAGAAIMAGVVFWFIYTESTYKEYCVCRHEFNEHYIVPRGFVHPLGAEKCMKCGCKAYKKDTN